MCLYNFFYPPFVWKLSDTKEIRLFLKVDVFLLQLLNAAGRQDNYVESDHKSVDEDALALLLGL